VVDIGCGTGGTIKVLSSRLGIERLVGLDRSREAVALAAVRTGRPIMNASATLLPFATSSVDACLMLDVLEHIPDDAAALMEVHRVLRPGGFLVLTVPCHPWLFSTHDLALGHVRRYTRKGLLALVQGVGLEPRRVSFANSLLFPAVAAYRLLRKVLPKSESVASDAALGTGPLNEVFKAVLMAERRLVRRFDLPVGLTLLVVAERV